MMSRHRIALATCAEVPILDEDGPALVAALGERSIDAAPAVWDDLVVDWSRFDLVVVRSTWDYVARRPEFLRWAERVDAVSSLANAPAVLSWDTDKAYLRQLASAGVPVVETYWPPSPSGLPDLDDFVVKPAVSAGCKDTARFARDDRPAAMALAHDIMGSGREVMVQPYLRSVDDHGETAVMFFAGELSHAIRKGGMLRHGQGLTEELFRAEVITAREPDSAEIAVAELALDACPFSRSELLYARVDLVRDPHGDPRVIELELAEPSLFLGHHPLAATRFADAIAARVVDGRPDMGEP